MTKIKYFILLILFCGTSTYGQLNSAVLNIEAKVIDAETKAPVPYASVGILGTYVGTSTNLEGQFNLSIDADNQASKQLRVSCVGFENATFPVGNIPPIIELKPSIGQLKDVLVLGEDINPDKIVRKAFSRIRKNYYSNHLCTKHSTDTTVKMTQFMDV